MIKDKDVRRCGGIYKIENVLNGDFYIGSSIDVYKRYYQHRTLLKRNKHHSIHLQNAWNKYGKDNFVFAVLEYTDLDVERLRELEQRYLDNLQPVYNSSLDVFNLSVTPRQESHRRNISSALRSSEIFQSPEFKNMISESVKSLWCEPDYRERQMQSRHSELGKKNYSNSMKSRWNNSSYKERVINSFKDNFAKGKPRNNGSRGIQEVGDILKIKKLYSSGRYTQLELAEMFKVGRSTISRILNEKSWGFVQ